jgi:hypothetical protein
LNLLVPFIIPTKQGNLDFKADYLRKNGVELFIDTKKELTIAENSLLKFIKFLNFENGGAKQSSN